jgi:hypothetical protein
MFIGKDSQGRLSAEQTFEGPAAVVGQPGIKFLAQFSLPADGSGNSGEYQWLQLLNQDTNQFVNDLTSSGTCTSFTVPVTRMTSVGFLCPWAV